MFAIILVNQNQINFIEKILIMNLLNIPQYLY